MKIIMQDKDSQMLKGYPRIVKMGAVHPDSESTPFVFNGRLMRLECVDTIIYYDPGNVCYAQIRDRETGEILSRFGDGCYFHSLYQEDGMVYVIAVVRAEPCAQGGDTLVLFESRDLKNWSRRTLFSRPGWLYYNTALTKGPDGYVLLMEAGEPADKVGHRFTFFFATSQDLVHWEFMDDDKCFNREMYNGGPWMRYSRGWYYVISVIEMPGYRFTNYLFRTRDFETWEYGKYNPILMPCEEDRKLSPYAHGFTPEKLRQMRTHYNSNNSDIDMCDWQGKTIITYACGNQLGFCYTCEAEYDGTVDEFLAANFDE